MFMVTKDKTDNWKLNFIIKRRKAMALEFKEASLDQAIKLLKIYLFTSAFDDSTEEKDEISFDYDIYRNKELVKKNVYEKDFERTIKRYSTLGHDDLNSWFFKDYFLWSENGEDRFEIKPNLIW